MYFNIWIARKVWTEQWATWWTWLDYVMPPWWKSQLTRPDLKTISMGYLRPFLSRPLARPFAFGLQPFAGFWRANFQLPQKKKKNRAEQSRKKMNEVGWGGGGVSNGIPLLTHTLKGGSLREKGTQKCIVVVRVCWRHHTEKWERKREGTGSLGAGRRRVRVLALSPAHCALPCKIHWLTTC